MKLNIGCGTIKLPGWINIDIIPGADLVIDVRNGLPFGNDSIDFIYSEHFIEHLTLEECEQVIKEFKRILKKGGCLRIATPDLDYIIEKYITNWKDQDWLSWPTYRFIKTRGQMINICFSWWGHKYMYNEEDLRNLLLKVGLNNISLCKLGISIHSDLSNLEMRKDSKLIIEITK